MNPPTRMVLSTQPPTVHMIPSLRSVPASSDDDNDDDGSSDVFNDDFGVSPIDNGNIGSSATPKERDSKSTVPKSTAPQYVVPHYGPADEIRLADPTLEEITYSETFHSPASTLPPFKHEPFANVPTVFDYIRFRIFHDRYYMGEAALGHYRYSNSSFCSSGLTLPKNPKILNPDGWYAVAAGRSIGIFQNW